jgi:uncharacterized protein DUF1707
LYRRFVDLAGPIRASDAEREAVVVQLQRAATEGRLTLDELDQRVSHAYTCRTRDELTMLVADLPLQPPPPPAPPAGTNTRDLLATIFGILALPVACTGPLSLGFGITAVVLGTRGLRQIRAGQPGNRGLAVTGVACGIVGPLLQFALFLVLFLFAGD